MRQLGYLLITIGFLGSSYYAVQDAEVIPLGPFLGCLALGIVGVVLVRVAIRREATHEGKLASSLEVLGAEPGTTRGGSGKARSGKRRDRHLRAAPRDRP